MPNLTIIDWAKRTDPDGGLSDFANTLSQTNAILQDAVYVQGNLPTGHRVTVATGLPTVYYRALNAGIPSSKATTSQVDEQCAILEARSEMDIDLAILNGNSLEFRASEARLFVEAMNQTMATGMFYGNPASDPKQFLGLAPRYSSTTAGNAQNLILAGGTNTLYQTSIWLICWSDNTVYNIFPKGSKAGLLQEDLGRYTAQNANGVTGNNMEVFGERFQWKTGLVVKDWRYAVRIANIEVANGGSNDVDQIEGVFAPTALTNLIHLMARAIARIPTMAMGRCAFYMNRTVFSALQRTALEKGAASGLTIQAAASQFGTPQAMMSFLGVPIRQCDAIVNTEALVA